MRTTGLCAKHCVQRIGQRKTTGPPRSFSENRHALLAYFVISTSSTLVVLVGLDGVFVVVEAFSDELVVALARKISTRRFSEVLPLGVLGTAGWNSPQPAASMR